MSDAAPAKVNEAETIPLGDVSFGQKSVSLFKIGKGFKLTDEVKNYVAIDVLGICLRDFGIQLGYAMDTLAMDVLMNGNKADGSESAPVFTSLFRIRKEQSVFSSISLNTLLNGTFFCWIVILISCKGEATPKRGKRKTKKKSKICVLTNKRLAPE